MEPLMNSIRYVIEYVSSMSEFTQTVNENLLLDAFNTIRELCQKSCQYHARNRKIIIYECCLVKLYFILSQSYVKLAILDKLLETLISLTKTNGKLNNTVH